MGWGLGPSSTSTRMTTPGSRRSNVVLQVNAATKHGCDDGSSPKLHSARIPSSEHACRTMSGVFRRQKPRGRQGVPQNIFLIAWARTPHCRNRHPALSLIVSLPRSMEGRFRLRQILVQPITQSCVELARVFTFASFTFAEEFDSASNLSGSGRRLFEPPNERPQLR